MNQPARHFAVYITALVTERIETRDTEATGNKNYLSRVVCKVGTSFTALWRSEPMPQSHFRHKAWLPNIADSMLWGLGVWHRPIGGDISVSAILSTLATYCHIRKTAFTMFYFCQGLQYTEKR